MDFHGILQDIGLERRPPPDLEKLDAGIHDRRVVEGCLKKDLGPNNVTLSQPYPNTVLVSDRDITGAFVKLQIERQNHDRFSVLKNGIPLNNLASDSPEGRLAKTAIGTMKNCNVMSL